MFQIITIGTSLIWNSLWTLILYLFVSHYKKRGVVSAQKATSKAEAKDKVNDKHEEII